MCVCNLERCGRANESERGLKKGKGRQDNTATQEFKTIIRENKRDGGLVDKEKSNGNEE